MHERIYELRDHLEGDAINWSRIPYVIVCAPGLPYQSSTRTMGAMMAAHLHTVLPEKLIINTADTWVWTTIAECFWAVRWARAAYRGDHVVFYPWSSPKHNRRIKRIFSLFPELRVCEVLHLSAVDEPTVQWQEWVSYGKLYVIYALAKWFRLDPARLSASLFRAPAIRESRWQMLYEWCECKIWGAR
jgi:hypothetical protein